MILGSNQLLRQPEQPETHIFQWLRIVGLHRQGIIL